MKTHARVVVIGGVVGAGTLYHLARQPAVKAPRKLTLCSPAHYAASDAGIRAAHCVGTG